MEQAQALDNQLILVAQGAQTDNKRQPFASASYLLISAGRASFRFTYSDNYNGRGFTATMALIWASRSAYATGAVRFGGVTSPGGQSG